jgi:hypothetical protein
MPPFICRCPNTGFRVQGWAPDLESETAGDVFCEHHMPGLRLDAFR